MARRIPPSATRRKPAQRAAPQRATPPRPDQISESTPARESRRRHSRADRPLRPTPNQDFWETAAIEKLEVDFTLLDLICPHPHHTPGLWWPARQEGHTARFARLAIPDLHLPAVSPGSKSARALSSKPLRQQQNGILHQQILKQTVSQRRAIKGPGITVIMQSGRYLQRIVGRSSNRPVACRVASHFASHVVALATALMPVSPVASRRTYLIRCDRCDGATAGLNRILCGDEQTDVRSSCKSDHRATFLDRQLRAGSGPRSVGRLACMLGSKVEPVISQSNFSLFS